MRNHINQLGKQCLYDGYLKVDKYNLEVQSLNPQNSSPLLIQRELISSHDSILALIYAPKIDSFVLTQEFRLGVFMNQHHDEPFILQGVAGTVDGSLTPEETAIKEIYEETGLFINTISLIAKAYKSPGLMTEKVFIYYAEYPGIPKAGLHGLAEEGEQILTKIMKKAQVYSLMDAMEIYDAATLIALNWFQAKD